ncbi:OmpA family protein [Microbacterium album]|uniref:Lipoprotein n=1 Tax=Microbacterium album TaxID=2053191 RepID=A0A917IGJ8_9MICO|nr:OmpA family protein [Microbacterium album]GGH47674.1 lipoprotein [Microbacterium album]
MAILSSATRALAVVTGSARRMVGRAPALALSTGVAATMLTSAYAWPSLDELDFPAARGDAVIRYSLDGSVTRYSAERRVSSFATEEQDGGETTISLSSDILFRFDSADLPGSAEPHLRELVEPVPEGETVHVEGHTDSVGDAAYNLDLSERRARAVADAIATARPDLVLEVRGHGETRPAVRETGDETAIAEAQAANRRVEIRYGS